MAADEIKLLLCKFNDFAIFSPGRGRAVVVSCWEGAMAICAFGLLCAVESSRPNMLIQSCTTVVAAGVSGAFSGIAEALAAWVVASDCCLFVNCL
jgi:hypothetical protein